MFANIQTYKKYIVATFEPVTIKSLAYSFFDWFQILYKGQRSMKGHFPCSFQKKVHKK